MISGHGILSAKKALGVIEAGANAYAILIITATGGTEIVTAGGAGEMSFLSMAFETMVHEIIKGFDPRERVELGLQSVPFKPTIAPFIPPEGDD